MNTSQLTKPTEALLPRPKTVRETDTPLRLTGRVALRGAASQRHWVVRPLAALLERLRIALVLDQDPGDGDVVVELQLRPLAGGRAQGYQLQIDTQGVRLAAADDRGLFYGICTLCQWIEQQRLAAHPASLQQLAGVEIEDWPDFGARGLLLDISRDKVPTMTTLLGLVDMLSSWKVNQLQLYCEHTFAYRGHESVWRDASPLTAEQVRELDRYCRARFIELVPNQNSFGHFHRWLIHEPYRRLAECPDGISHPFSEVPEPFGLCPIDPGSLELLQDLYGQLLPNFSSTMFNVGLDETLDLGLCRSKEICQRDGREEVYLGFLGAVERLVRGHGRRMQFWSDIVLQRPDLLSRIPSDTIALCWGYEAEHPFDRQLQLLSEAGIDHYVCPGTSSWNSLAGRASNALCNLARAAAAGVAHRTCGYLITDWGDNGHLQPLPVSYFGMLAGAAAAWNAGAAVDLDRVGPLLARHAFADPTGNLGEAAVALAGAHELSGATPTNGTMLFRLLVSFADPLTHRRYRGADLPHLRQVEAKVQGALEQLGRACPQRADGSLLVNEFRWVGEVLLVACALGRARMEAGLDVPVTQLPSPVRRALARQLQPLVEQHAPLWLSRNRAGGRRDSVSRLQKLCDALRS